MKKILPEFCAPPLAAALMLVGLVVFSRANAAPAPTRDALNAQADRIVAGIDRANEAIAAGNKAVDHASAAIDSLTKQLETSRAQTSALQQQVQQQQVAVEFYKNLAERNEALLRNALLTTEVAELRKAVDEAKAKPAPAEPAKK